MSGNDIIKLETERLILRQFKLSDAEAMHQNITSIPEVVRFMCYDVCDNLDATQKHVNQWFEYFDKLIPGSSWCVFAIILKSSNELIGTIDFHENNREARAAEIGYQIGRTWWGKGYTTEALRIVIDYCFSRIGLNRLWADYDSRNVASGKVLLKAGMLYEGTARQCYVRKGHIVDKVSYAILAEDYFKESKTGWERDNRTHFDDIVLNYDKVRWDYPAELFTDAIKYAGVGDGKQAIEIGAGTGKATAPFLDVGYSVTAVEMGQNMTEFLLDKFRGYANFNVITSTFEEAPLEENSYDLIYAASAFHWVDAEVGCPKVLRLLKSGGAFTLFRNNAIRPEGDDLDIAIEAVYDKHYYNHYKRYNRPVGISKMTYEDYLQPAEIHRGFRFESLEQYGFRDIMMKLYDATRAYSADEYIALLETYSDHRALPNDNRAALYEGVRNAIIKHGGYQKLNFVFQLYMGRKT